MWNRNSHAGNRPAFLSRIDDVALFAVGWQHHCGPWVSALYTMQCSFHLLTDLYSPCFLQKWQKTFSLDVTQPGCFLALICSHGFLVTGFLMSVKKTSWEMNQNKALSNRSQCEFLQHKGKIMFLTFHFCCSRDGVSVSLFKIFARSFKRSTVWSNTLGIVRNGAKESIQKFGQSRNPEEGTKESSPKPQR